MSKPFKYGDIDKRGFTFRGWGRDGYPIWLSPDAFHRNRILQCLLNARRRAKKKNIPCDVTVDYLLSIFPKDGKCPVFNEPLVWGTKNIGPFSPSLDRIKPSEGYTKGNLIWVSSKANSIKQNASADEILAVGRFYSTLIQ